MRIAFCLQYFVFFLTISMQSSFKIDLERFILRRDRGAHKVISTNDESDLNQPTNLLKRELRAAQFEIDLFIQSFLGSQLDPSTCSASRL